MNATVEIEITPPGPPGTRPWWTLYWNGASLRVETAPGLEGDAPSDWGIPYADPAYTDAWREEGGNDYVIEQLLDGFSGAGARARIVRVHGEREARRETLAGLTAFAAEHPQCAAELRRFVAETEPN